MNNRHGKVYSNLFAGKCRCTAALMSAAILSFSSLSGTAFAGEIFDDDLQVPTLNNQFITLGDLAVLPEKVSDIFDPVLYRSLYPEVAEQVGSSAEALLEHFITVGLPEGRIGSRYMEIAAYRALYPDLDKAFGDDWDAYVKHFFTYGLEEKRSNGFTLKEDSLMQNAQAHEKKNAAYGSGGSGSRNNTLYEEAGVYQTLSGVLFDHNGSIFIPWKNVDDFHYLTMDELHELLGDSMILLTDSDGNVTFVAGNFTNLTVNDEEKAKEAVHSMMLLMNFPEETKELYLTNDSYDSLGNHYYRFSAMEKDGEEILDDLTDIVVGADPQGQVLCIAANDASEYVTDPDELAAIRTKLSMDDEKFKNTIPKLLQEVERDEDDNVSKYVTAVADKPVRRYIFNDNRNNFYWCAVITWSDGTIEERPLYLASPEDESYDTSLRPHGVHYDSETYAQGMQDPEDNLFRGEAAGTITRKNAFGTDVDLPIVYDETTGEYFLCDKERGIICVINDLGPYDDYHNRILNRYSFTDPFNFTLDERFVTAFKYVQYIHDAYEEMGLWEAGKKPIIVGFNDLQKENASASNVVNALNLDLYKNDIAVSLDVIAHEFTHNALFQITGDLQYENYTGALNEAYADILGNLIEMKLYEELGADYVGPVDLEKWKLNEVGTWLTQNHERDVWDLQRTEEFRNLSNPSAMGNPDKIGAVGYIMPPAYDGSTDDDGNGVHFNSNIISHIAYRMEKELGMDRSDLIKVWYDTLSLLTESSSFTSVEKNLIYVMRNHGMEEQIQGVQQLFRDANIPEDNLNPLTWANMPQVEGAQVLYITTVDEEDPCQNIYKNLYNFDVGYDGGNGTMTEDFNDVIGAVVRDGGDIFLSAGTNGAVDRYVAGGLVIKDADLSDGIRIDGRDLSVAFLNNMLDAYRYTDEEETWMIEQDMQTYIESQGLREEEFRYIKLMFEIDSQFMEDSAKIKLYRTDPSGEVSWEISQYLSRSSDPDRDRVEKSARLLLLKNIAYTAEISIERAEDGKYQVYSGQFELSDDQEEKTARYEVTKGEDAQLIVTRQDDFSLAAETEETEAETSEETDQAAITEQSAERPIEAELAAEQESGEEETVETEQEVEQAAETEEAEAEPSEEIEQTEEVEQEAEQTAQIEPTEEVIPAEAAASET